MLQIQPDFPIQRFNTFGIQTSAAFFSTLNQESTIQEIYEQAPFRKGLFILGGGSNVLFTKNVAQWVLHNQIKGIEKIKENEDQVWLRSGGGEAWHDFVLYCVRHNYAGAENLSLIPGTVGAAPMQNIGAYGAEVKDLIEEVRAWHLEEKRFLIFNNKDCRFGYRDSIFKQQYKQKLIITSVLFKLNKKPVFNISYGNIREELEKMQVDQLTIKNISDAVIRIRTAKLPDPKIIGNAGSFFKNPEVDNPFFEKLKSENPNMPGYKTSASQTKIPAGWLIEKCGWKGFRKDDFGVHKNQALVLVNYGTAKGADIYMLSEEILQSVKKHFDIELQREVQIV
jgi:UDP-N-acetylmuramate dehydrogenase